MCCKVLWQIENDFWFLRRVENLHKRRVAGPRSAKTLLVAHSFCGFCRKGWGWRVGHPNVLRRCWVPHPRIFEGAVFDFSSVLLSYPHFSRFSAFPPLIPIP